MGVDGIKKRFFFVQIVVVQMASENSILVL